MFNSVEIGLFFNAHKKTLRSILELIDSLKFEAAQNELETLNDIVENFEKTIVDSDDESLNELFIFKELLDLLKAYNRLWSNIFLEKFSSSWSDLQGALGYLRLIKKFSSNQSNNQIEFFEDQLLELEKLYPYNIFVSIGATVDWFECSICGEDIDGYDCPHIKGELYRGRMAYGIVRNLKNIDHIAFVYHPEDKCCVIQYDDDGPQFKLIRYLSSIINHRKLTPLRFLRAELKKRKIENPDYLQQPRNDLCKCRSGLKFKKCCIKKKYIEIDHVDIVGGESPQH